MLIDFKLNNGLYIHSLSEPFNEEMEISYYRLQNWLNYFDLRFYQAHCSGHISGSELKGIIEEINPKMLFPIHTEHPERFDGLSTKVQIVKEGESYRL